MADAVLSPAERASAPDPNCTTQARPLSGARRLGDMVPNRMGR
jgi:hypothetical protein